MLASARSSILAIFILIPLLYIISVSHAPLQGLKIFSKPAANHSSTFSDEPEVVFDENPRGAPRIRQASMVFGDREDAVFERSLRTHFRHGSRWGYPTHILRQDALGNKDFSKLVYNKILYLQTLVVKEMIKSPEQRSEWIVWFDVDTVLLNQNIPWTAFLPPGDGFQDVHFLVSKDMNGLNIGIFFVRVNDWTIKMLSDVLALPSLRPDVEIGHNAEQDAMRWVLEQSRNREHVLYQPQHWYNAYEHADSTHPLHNGDLLVHFAGYGDKGPAMSKWLDRLEGENADLLQPPMAHTTYPHQVREYWARLRRAREVFREVDEHRKEEWGHLSDQDAIKRVEDAEKILKDHLWNEAQDGERITKDTSTVKDSLEAMDKKREENEKKKKEKEGGKKEGEEERRKKKREKSQEGRS